MRACTIDMEMLLRMQVWHDTVATRRDADEINVKRYQPPTAAPC